jgi:uncharacterized Zn-finger protein
LTKHIRSHENAHLRWNRTTSEKPYKCTFYGCDKSFTAKSSLQIHINTAHTGAALDDDELSPSSPPSDSPPPSKPSLTLDMKRVKPVEKTVQEGGAAQQAPKVKKEKTKDAAAARKSTLECSHPNCKKSFTSESDLRDHLNAAAPQLASESKFFRENAAKLFSLVERWSAIYPGFRAEADALVNMHELRSTLAGSYVPPRMPAVVSNSSSAASSVASVGTGGTGKEAASKDGAAGRKLKGKKKGKAAAGDEKHGSGKNASTDEFDDAQHLSLQTVCGILDGLKASPRIDESQYPAGAAGLVMYPHMPHLQSYPYPPPHPSLYNSAMYGVPGAYPYPVAFPPGYPAPPGYPLNVTSPVTVVEGGKASTDASQGKGSKKRKKGGDGKEQGSESASNASSRQGAASHASSAEGAHGGGKGKGNNSKKARTVEQDEESPRLTDEE